MLSELWGCIKIVWKCPFPEDRINDLGRTTAERRVYNPDRSCGLEDGIYDRCFCHCRRWWACALCLRSEIINREVRRKRRDTHGNAHEPRSAHTLSSARALCASASHYITGMILGTVRAVLQCRCTYLLRQMAMQTQALGFHGRYKPRIRAPQRIRVL